MALNQKSFQAGLVYAAGWVHQWHGNTVEPVEMMESAGMTRDDIANSDAGEHDIKWALKAWDIEHDH